MGSGNITTRANATPTDAAWFNEYQSALSLDIVPRDASAVATDEGASLGSATYKFKKMNVASGYFKPGDIKWRHSYNGTVTVSQGWMLCDGREVTKDNYDTEHGAGSWDLYIGVSAIQNKKLPNLIDRYAKGVDDTTQNGDAAITSVGTANHLYVTDHAHKWYIATTSAAADKTYGPNDMVGKSLAPAEYEKNDGVYLLPIIPSTSGMVSDLYTATVSQSVDIQPDSIEAMPYMRII